MKLGESEEIVIFDTTVDAGRRSAMRKIAVGVGVLASYSVLPESWTKPIIGQIVLPAHAGTSGSSLHDPCQVELRGGDHTTEEIILKITGFVTPPVANLPVTITSNAVGGSNQKVETKATTSTEGTFEVQVTIGGGPGITSVNVTTEVRGADGVANCVVHTTATPSSPAQDVAGYFRGDVPDGGPLCISIINGVATFYAFENDHKYITGTGSSSAPSISGNTSQCGDTEDTTLTISGIASLSSSGGNVVMDDNDGHQATVTVGPVAGPCINGNECQPA